MKHFLCMYDEISPCETRSFVVQDQNIFVVRSENKVFAYRNQCPHLGVELEWQPDRFLNYEKTHIQCSTHGALFEMHSGRCIQGPCQGQHLDQLVCDIEEEKVFVTI